MAVMCDSVASFLPGNLRVHQRIHEYIRQATWAPSQGLWRRRRPLPSACRAVAAALHPDGAQRALRQRDARQAAYCRNHLKA